MTVVLDRVLGIRVSVAQKEIGKVISGVEAVETEVALSAGEQVLDLLVQRPAAAKFKLVRSLGPRNIIPELVIVRDVDPGLGNVNVADRLVPVFVVHCQDFF